MTARIQDKGLANLVLAWSGYASVPKYLQWGTGSAAAKTANVVTTTSTTESRTTGTVAQASSGNAGSENDIFRVTGTITAAGSRAITEVGVFDAAGSGSPPTGGNMCIYGDFSTINLATNDSIAFTVNVTFA